MLRLQWEWVIFVSELKLVKYIVSLFLTGLFVLPVAFESAHGWFHHHESICHDTQSNHLHNIQHQCKICDVYPTALYTLLIHEAQRILEADFIQQPVTGLSVNSVLFILPHFLRGPPSLP